jgi:hypothetical protein
LTSGGAITLARGGFRFLTLALGGRAGGLLLGFRGLLRVPFGPLARLLVQGRGGSLRILRARRSANARTIARPMEIARVDRNETGFIDESLPCLVARTA